MPKSTDSPFIITFPGASRADANQYASSLAAALRDLSPDLTVEQRRDRPDTQDFGATLAIVLGSASATAVAHGIAAWLRRHNTRVTVEEDGKIILENVDGRDAAAIAQAVFSRRE